MSALNDLEKFTDFTGASQDQAQFYLDSAKGDVNVHKVCRLCCLC